MKFCLSVENAEVSVKVVNLKALKQKSILIVLGALSISVVLFHLEFNFFEAFLYDLKVKHSRAIPHDPNIVLVTLDDKTTANLNDYAPLSLETHTQFLKSISEYQPLSIGYLINMNDVHQVDPLQFQDNRGTNFINEAKQLELNGVPFIIGTPFDINGEVIPPYPLSSLNHSVAIIHKDGNVFAQDKVTRRALTHLYSKPTFHLLLANKSNLIQKKTKIRGSFYVPEADGDYFFFRYRGNKSPYLRVSFVDVLEKKVSKKLLKNKIILVDTLLKENPSNFAKTPLSKNPFTNPRVTIHANILDSIIHNDGIILAPQWVNWVITFIITAFVLWAVLSLTPLYGVLATLGSAILFFVFSYLLFQKQGGNPGIWVRGSQPLISIFLSYYLVVPYRLIQEYKKRWDYQKKNEILTQVEELKTNFLSLVTHDLKTPVARIQGLTEVILGKSKNGLVSENENSLKKIISSTDELNQFISKTLELTKVESNHITINFESKDINTIIERCIDTFKTDANLKNINIKTSLEPLFPIKIDPILISKVINNLIDNAVKYSPENTTIFISSKETGDHIEILIKDGGIGITNLELEHLFSKFYRAKNDTTATISGSGLGLYLTKYFVEAHNGTVSVKSNVEKGSQFTIRLPIYNNSKKQFLANSLTNKTPRFFNKIKKLFNSNNKNKEKKYV